MAKTITLRIEESKYNLIKEHALKDNRSLSNYIETATLHFINEVDFCDDLEMNEVINNDELLRNLNKGSKDAKERKGTFI